MPFQRKLALICGVAALVSSFMGQNEAQAGRLAAARAARAAAYKVAATQVAATQVAATQVAAAHDPCVAPAPPCCPAPCIIYRHLGPSVCCGCAAPVPTVLNVVDPCTCCPLEIPVCLPACCTGTPVVCSRPGLFASSVVTYDWCCGFNVTIRFRRSGEVVVVTRGV